MNVGSSFFFPFLSFPTGMYGMASPHLGKNQGSQGAKDPSSLYILLAPRSYMMYLSIPCTYIHRGEREGNLSVPCSVLFELKPHVFCNILIFLKPLRWPPPSKCALNLHQDKIHETHKPHPSTNHPNKNAPDF